MSNNDTTSNPTFRILSIDGGGIRGIIPAKGLAMIEDELQKRNKPSRICDYFDLICGTSTGAILAIALALGIPAKDLLNLYMKHAKEIFPPQNKVKKLFRFLKNRGTYDRKILSSLIEETYREATGGTTAKIGHCQTRVCIPTYDVSRGEMHVLKTSHHPEFIRDFQIPAHNAALASAAAPIYFDAYSFDYQLDNSIETNSYRYNVDGGIMANNPTLIGYIEAIRTLDQKPEDLQILSLGTGDAPYADPRKALKMGGRYWITNKNSFFALYDLISSAQSVYVDNIMKFLQVGAASGTSPIFEYERIQQQFAPGKNVAMDCSDPLKLKALERIGEKLFRDKTKSIIDSFCKETRLEFIPNHKLS